MAASGRLLAPAGAAAPAARWRAAAALAAGAAAAYAAGWLTVARSPLVAAGAAGGALLGAWSLRRVEVALYGLVAVVALLPFGVVPLRLGVAPTFLDVATGALFFLWLVRAALRISPVRVSPVGVALGAYVAALVAAYLLAGESLRPGETARTFAKVVAAHLAFLPLLSLLAERGHARRLAVWLAVCACAEALVALALYAAPRGLALRALTALGPLGYPTDDSVLRYRPDTDVLRATGTAIDPNMLGALLMVAGAILVPQLVAARPYLPRPVALALLAPIGLCLLLTESRGSWLGLAGAVLFVALKQRRLWPLLAAVGVTGALLPQTQRFTSHLLSGLQAQDRAAAMRLGEIQNALGIIARHPWWGAGWSEAGKSIELAFTFGVSNVFLTVAERSGIPAAVLYAAVLLTLAAVLWRPVATAFRDPEDDGLLVGLAGALVATQIAGMLDHHFVRFPHLVTLLWLTAALAVAAAGPSPRHLLRMSPSPTRGEGARG